MTKMTLKLLKIEAINDDIASILTIIEKEKLEKDMKYIEDL